MNFISESRLHNIIRESVNKLLLTESQVSKSISAAKRKVMQELGYNEKQADEFVRIKLRGEITSLRTNEGGRFIEGVARMWCAGQLDDDETKSRLNTTLKYIASDAHINEYSRDLNGMSAQDLIDRFASNIEMDLENDIKKNDSMKFDGPSDYQIVRIDSFEQAQEYYEYTYPHSRWCLTYMENQFKAYTRSGINQIYFCLRNGFENMEPVKGEGCPLDEYGLSMISVIVNGDGSLVHCTSRWNHSNGGDDNVMDTEQISNVIKMGFYKVFKPNTKWKDMLENVMQRLANGEHPEDVFDKCFDCENGFTIVKLNDKYNYINQNGQFLTELPTTSQLIKGKWFDGSGYFSEGFATIKLNGKFNFINEKAEIVFPNQWFDWCGFFSEGYAVIGLEGRYNFINKNGELLSDQWFESCGFFTEGWGTVRQKGKVNFINKNGQIITELPTADESIKGKWFDTCFGFQEGFARVFNGLGMNFINQNGELLFPNQWFDWCDDFEGGVGRVRVDDEWYYIDRNGIIIEGPPTMTESVIRDIIRESVIDFIKNDI